VVQGGFLAAMLDDTVGPALVAGSSRVILPDDGRRLGMRISIGNFAAAAPSWPLSRAGPSGGAAAFRSRNDWVV